MMEPTRTRLLLWLIMPATSASGLTGPGGKLDVKGGNLLIGSANFDISIIPEPTTNDRLFEI